MKYPLPLEIVRGRYPIVSQEFGDPSRAEYYKAHGININAHNGTDIVISGGSSNTYGTKLVCPAPTALLNKVWQLDPMSTSGNGVQCQWQDERGTIKMTVWHCSETNRQSEYKLGDTLGYMGNSGLVDPVPSVFNVFAGSHLHLGVKINDVLADPREVFDFTKWTVSETDTGIEKDLPPFLFYLSKIAKEILTLKVF